MAEATVADLLAAGTRALVEAGVRRPRFEARLALGHILGVDAATVIGHPERPVDEESRRRYAEIITRRKRREPWPYIVGLREFWSLPFRVTPDTLVPRPETETLVEAALAFAAGRDAPMRLVDLGTGSGCLLLALLSELPKASGIGVDRSEAALAVARANAESLGLESRVRLICGDWAESVRGPYDLTVCNPPYVAEGEIDSLDAEIARFEPRAALAGGADGLDAFRAIAPHLLRLVAPGGAAFFEVGAGQAPQVAAMLSGAGLQHIEIRNDLAGIPRCVGGFRARSRRAQKKAWKPNASRLVSMGVIDRVALRVTEPRDGVFQPRSPLPAAELAGSDSKRVTGAEKDPVLRGDATSESLEV